MTLTGKQKHYLRSQAHHLRPIFSVGKNGLNETWLNQLDGALQHRELIKINLQQSADVAVDDVQAFIEENTPIAVVQKKLAECLCYTRLLRMRSINDCRLKLTSSS